MAGVAAGSNEKARVCERVEARRSEDGVEGANGGGLYGGREARTTLRSSTTISISSRHQIRLVAQEPSAYSKLG
ncbi:hypothetical protein HZH68_009801 [Vespula germanica]|uniref:Uncharacterized protein n=1 Tax=Vespula germanica TaxID=30212 RepID=A0A834JWH8_VESGE|nr:hypothetical protein HZH68_009801 [Vespula germanica]